jgi:serine/threonine protein kinase
MRCTACDAEIARAGRFCPECAAPLVASPANQGYATETIAMRHQPPSSSSSSSEDGRFPPGTLLTERYRVIGIIGRGGMGEVYRASDLKLNQPVALKFLPEEVAAKPGLLERFHGEVRIARQVSHPNVCRVYDIGEAEGSAFISMEYVDGEDLGGLLRRIGRLPSDKAIEIARKLCAGLAAAHAKGVLHRDLKPANIMIDGRGQVLIMDFGLAALADTIAAGDARSGTPAYMAPEQLKGKEVSERSDIYALGLVLHEVFTGQRAFKSNDRSNIPSAVSVVKDIDPVIDTVIARCLDPDPAKRPQSALALARTLPGGDPLAEALAAGDTPPPAMVAASDNTGSLSVRGAVVCMAAVVIGLLVMPWLSSKSNIVNQTPLPNSPEILKRQAREIASRLGYPDAPVDDTWLFSAQTAYEGWAKKNLKPEEFRELVRRGQPRVIDFWYRMSPQYMEPRDPTVTDNDPPFLVPGMVRMVLDPEGRLAIFRAVPPQVVDANAAAQPMNWDKVFEAAGLDRSRWTEVESQELPQFPFDERKAWKGTFEHAPQVRMQIEAAAWRGRAVSFELFGPWRAPVRVQPPTAAQTRIDVVFVVVIAIVLLAGSWLAWRNYRAGRGDVSSARRLVVIGFLGALLARAVTAHHVPTAAEGGYLADALQSGLFVGAVTGLLYLAVEPFIRRRWSQSLISWTRFLSGKGRDSMVAGHLLLGVACGVGMAVLENALGWYRWRQMGVLAPSATATEMLDPAQFVRQLLAGIFGPAAILLGLLLLFLLFRLIVRNTWVAAVGVVALMAAVNQDPVVGGVFGACLMGLTLRFGILPAVLMYVFAVSVEISPMTPDLSAWYASRGLVVMGLALALAVWSFRHALGGRKVLKGDLFEP